MDSLLNNGDALYEQSPPVTELKPSPPPSKPSVLSKFIVKPQQPGSQAVSRKESKSLIYKPEKGTAVSNYDARSLKGLLGQPLPSIEQERKESTLNAEESFNCSPEKTLCGTRGPSFG